MNGILEVNAPNSNSVSSEKISSRDCSSVLGVALGFNSETSGFAFGPGLCSLAGRPRFLTVLISTEGSTGFGLKKLNSVWDEVAVGKDA